VIAAGGFSFGSTIVYTAGTVQTLDSTSPTPAPANPATPPVVDAASNSTLPEGETLANFTTLVANAYTANTGGVINFEQVDENGAYNNGTTTGQTVSPAFSWPSQGNSTNNGFTLGNGPTNAVQVNYGVSQPTATQAYSPAANVSGVTVTNTSELVGGTNSITFWRDLYTANGGVPVGSGNGQALGVTAVNSNATQTNTSDGFDSNNGENGTAGTGVTPTSGISYVGITNDGTPVVLDFTSDPLSAFGINVLDRNSTRPLQVDITLANGTVIKSSTEANAGASGDPNIFFGFNLTASDLANDGGITYVTLDSTSVDRYDDLAFVVAPVPEPASLGVLSIGSLVLLRRKRD
jgi:hypothetical protein